MSTSNSAPKSYICSYCGGRKIIDDKECLVCLGKGRIELKPGVLDEYFERFREKGNRE